MLAPPMLLSRYIARQFLVAFLGLFGLLVAIIWLFQFVEMLREFQTEANTTVWLAIRLAALRVPDAVDSVFHFTVLFSAMFTFWRLTRSQELIVARAAGISVWQFLLPVMLVALLIGGVGTMVLNPVGAGMLSQFQQIEERRLEGRSNLLEVSRAGLWLRERDADGFSVIYASRTEPDAIVLRDVTIFRLGADDGYRARIDGDRAVLGDGEWILHDASVSRAGNAPVSVPEYRLPTAFDRTTIHERFAAPDYIGFWRLPEFIETLEQTGFAAERHRLHYYSLLAQPVFLAAMVPFAAAFSLRMTRRGGILLMVVAGVMTGFALFLLADLVKAAGLLGQVPVVLAAGAPAGISLMLGLAMMLHLEDG